MKALPFHIVTGFSDLVERSHEMAFDHQFPENGKFLVMARAGRGYWYHIAHDPAMPNKQKSRYAGPVGDDRIEALVASHREANAAYKARKASASSMRQSGLPTPDALEGALALEFQKAGLFQGGAVLVGSVAYQCYGGLLGVRLDGAHHRTQDLDIAQDREIALHVASGDQKLEDFETILKRVDPSFSPQFNPMRPKDGPTRYKNDRQYRVDLLTSHLKTDRDRSAPVTVPSLPGVSLQPLDLMDYLIEEPVRSVLLHETGVAVTVPDPCRYAMHKIAISQMRAGSDDASKSAKDLSQVSELLRALIYAKRYSGIASAWNVLFDEKPKIRTKLITGALSLDQDALGHLSEAVIRFGGNPFIEGEDPAKLLRKFLGKGDGPGPGPTPGPSPASSRYRRPTRNDGYGR